MSPTPSGPSSRRSRPRPLSARPARGAISVPAIIPSLSSRPAADSTDVTGVLAPHEEEHPAGGLMTMWDRFRRDAARRRGGRVPREAPEQPAGLPPFDDEPELIEPGLWRIPVPLPFALRSANIYLIAGGDGGWTLVDAGLGLPADEAALRDGLARSGVGIEQVTALVLTHAHPDH